MKRFAARFSVTTLVVLSAIAGSAMAQSNDRIDTRQLKQEQRIDKGTASGALNAQETQRLEKQQGHVDKVENKALADGKVSGKERAHIEHAQDVQSRHIEKQKHDGQHDYNHNGRNDRSERRHNHHQNHPKN